jgi:hypothetical protein
MDHGHSQEDAFRKDAVKDAERIALTGGCRASRLPTIRVSGLRR